MFGDADGSGSNSGGRYDFYGPQFIVSPDGKPLDLFALNKVTSRPFNGGAHQQWAIVDDGTSTKFALKSEHNYLFVGVNRDPQGTRLVAKVEPFYWAISESGGSYRLLVPDTRLALSLGETANMLPSMDSRTELFNLENTRGNGETIMKLQGRIARATLPTSHPPASFMPPPIASAPCCAVYRRFGTSTQRLTLAPHSSVDTLPYGILLMRATNNNEPPDSVQAGILLQLVATLRDSVCHMPPVFFRRTGRGFWDNLAPVFRPVDSKGMTFAFTLMGLVDLAAVIPGPATIDFTRIPIEQAEVITSNGDRVDTAQWGGGPRCVGIAFRSFVLSQSILFKTVRSLRLWGFIFVR